MWPEPLSQRHVPRRLTAALAALLFSVTIVAGAQAFTWQEPIVVAGANSGTYPGSLITFGTSGSIVAYTTRTAGGWQSYLRRTENGVTTVIPFFAQGEGLLAGAPAPSLAARRDSVDAVWLTGDLGGEVISYRRSSDTGVTWSARKDLTSQPADLSLPRVARNAGDKVAVVWSDITRRVRIRVSTNDGATFRPARTVTDGYSPSVAIAGRVIVVAYGVREDGRYHLHVRRSTDNGTTWSASAMLARNAGGAYAYAAGSTVMVGYTRRSGFVAVRRSTDAGLTWDQPVALSSKLGQPATSLVLSARGGIWRVAFEQCPAGGCSAGLVVRYRQSADHGLTWSPRETVTTTTKWNTPTGVAATDGGPLVVWNADSNATGDTVALGTGIP